MSLFHLSVPEKREVPFSNVEYECMEKAFPADQKPIHFAMRANIRYQKESRKTCAAALSSHFICLFSQEKVGEELDLWATVHISAIEMIAHKEGEFVLLKTADTNVTFTGDDTTKFAQLVYRNYCLSYSLNDPDDVVEVRTDNMSLFPDIRLQTSPSQRFQFAYFATCSLNKVKFNQDVVRYIHSLLLSGNSIVDLSLLPVNLFGSSKSSDYLFPIFNSLKLLRYISGICLSNTERPDVVKALVPVVSYCDNMRIVHFENCGVTDGLEELAHEVHKSESFSVSYWNLSKNKFTDFEAFPRLIDESTEPLLYINLNDCGISAENSARLFRALRHSDKIESLKYFYYAGNDLTSEDAIAEFGGFLKVAKLETLDLSRYSDGAEDVLRCLNQFRQPLKNLVLAESNYSTEAITQLLIFIKESETLRELDVSAMNLPPESIAGIIHAIVLNKSLRDMSLKLDNLDLHDDNLLPIFRAFLDEEKLSKWRELSFNGNGMKYDDLKNLIPLFKRMRKLESISVSDNFNSDMYGIGMLLKDLLKIETLKKVCVAGGKSNHLGDELQPFLRALAKHPELVYLDISKNAMGNHTIPYVIQILHDCHKLEALMIDDNAFETTDKLDQLIDAVDGAKALISFGFPVTDSVAMVSAMGDDDEEAKNIVIARLAEMQINAAKAINEHRLKKGLPGELPFDVKPEIMELIKSISHITKKRMAQNNEKMKIHSCVCEVFGLPLPFQKMGEVVTDGGPVVDVEIGDMKVYETESMGRIVKELNANYPDFYNTTTMGPNLKSVLTGGIHPLAGIPMGDSAKKSKKRSHRAGDAEKKHRSSTSDESSEVNKKSRKTRHSDSKKRHISSDSEGNEVKKKWRESSDDSDDVHIRKSYKSRSVSVSTKESKKKRYHSSDDSDEKRMKGISSSDDGTKKSRKSLADIRSSKKSRYASSDDDSDEKQIKRQKSSDDSSNAKQSRKSKSDIKSSKRKSRRYTDDSEESDIDKTKSRKQKWKEDSDSEDSSMDDRKHTKKRDDKKRSRKQLTSSDTGSSESSESGKSGKLRKFEGSRKSDKMRKSMKDKQRVKWSSSVQEKNIPSDLKKAASYRMEARPQLDLTLETRVMGDDDIDHLMEMRHKKKKNTETRQSKLFIQSYKARPINPSKYDAGSSSDSADTSGRPPKVSPKAQNNKPVVSSDLYSSDSSNGHRQKAKGRGTGSPEGRKPGSKHAIDSNSSDTDARPKQSGSKQKAQGSRLHSSSSDDDIGQPNRKGTKATGEGYDKRMGSKHNSSDSDPFDRKPKAGNGPRTNPLYSSSSGEASPRSKNGSDDVFQVPNQRPSKGQNQRRSNARRPNHGSSYSSDSEEIAQLEQKLCTRERLAVSSLTKPPHFKSKQTIIDYAENVLLAEQPPSKKPKKKH